ncbi:MAG: energy-coupling factor ABC transporter permease [Meiothermus sp.]|uniref:energy-coupling factor ABC transporter permease n=1 Tax=Meiothermus sp. TaxID=1955249 RepID=UPI0025E4AD3B|nr:energy-coupling factor ABC transporter permease [Meiothermus sp.]MCS7057743.1 energy-coupling factor ABC transporter permease [Meiothermus sp.]MCS7194470.1 energy-coupling factor ABC transporter permease [Meiothermus sp.]MCX7740030.1 energy-coupling factor ABC transporter permease [Meiothermus sp.]MDW8091564.1 energy-coupling factor ABC transporter permease [Meiothermus sp.]MDW8482327.1 energy-coupling factor ABC transporter permease [Meiothermus sp.]
MHIEPGVVQGAKVYLGYATGAVGLSLAVRAAVQHGRTQGVVPLALRSFLAALVVFVCFEVLPHPPVGVSEVHLILGTTIYLLFGLGPAAVGLAMGLLVQGLFFAPTDLPQYGMNVTTLLFPLFAVHLVARRIVAPGTPYVELRYGQVLRLSATYQGGIVAWVAFWALYGHGLTSENLAQVASFGAAYLLVLLVEPLVDLAVLAAAKALHGLRGSSWVQPRLYEAA